MEMREKYYQDLEDIHEEYDIFLHDMKHAMRAIAALAKEGNSKEIGHLLERLRVTLGDIEGKMICSDKILNALLSERKGYAEGSGVMMELDIREPLYLEGIDSVDLITLMGNLLDNAIEAEKGCKKREGIQCSMRLAKEGRHLLVQIENSYEEKAGRKASGGSVRGRIGQKRGIGLGSVRRVVKKYGGIMENEKSRGRYRVKVILPLQNDRESAIA